MLILSWNHNAFGWTDIYWYTQIYIYTIHMYWHKKLFIMYTIFITQILKKSQRLITQKVWIYVDKSYIAFLLNSYFSSRIITYKMHVNSYMKVITHLNELDTIHVYWRKQWFILYTIFITQILRNSQNLLTPKFSIYLNQTLLSISSQLFSTKISK